MPEDRRGEWLFLGRRRLLHFRHSLVSDDLVLNFVVLLLSDNLLRDQVVLGPVRAAVNDFLRGHGTNAGQGLKLLLAGGVDVQLIPDIFVFSLFDPAFAAEDCEA